MPEEPPKNAAQGKAAIRFQVLLGPWWKLLKVAWEVGTKTF